MDASCLFLNINFPVAAWAAARGILVPALAGKNETGWLSVMLATLIRSEKISRLKNEQTIERIRLGRHANTVSRMTGLFFFEDRANAERASKLWRGSFTMENLTDIELLEDAPTSRYDSNWYTYAPKEDGLFTMQDIGWVDHYLAGEPMPTKEPIWESVTESRIRILSTDLQDRAVSLVHSQFPESPILLEIARAGARVGFDIGNVNAFFRQTDNRYILDWRLDMRDSESPEFLKRLQEPGVIGDISDFLQLMPPDMFFRVPDFRPYNWEGDATPLGD